MFCFSSQRGVARKALVAGVFFAASLTGMAVAQDAEVKPSDESGVATNPEEKITLDPIVILGKQEDATGPVGGSNNPPTVTGSKAPVYASEVPQSLTVLGKDDLQRFNADRVSEVLRYTPGVMMDVFGDDNDTDWMRIRGFQAEQNGVYLDNAQNLSFAFGSFYTDPYALERIEVLRGPSSALYGGSNPGGIANYVSKRPGARVREAVFKVDDAPAGSVALDIGDPLGDGKAYRVVGRFEGGDKYDDFNSGERVTFAPSFKFATKAGTEVTLLANAHFADEQHNGSTFLPYFGTVQGTSQFGFIDDDANFSDPDWDEYRRSQFSATGIVEHVLDNDFTFTGIGRVGVASIEESYWFPFGYAGFSATPTDNVGSLALIGFEHDTLTRTAQADLRYYGVVETGAISHDLLIGLDPRYYLLDETQASAIGANRVVNPFNPGTPVLGAPFQDARTSQLQVGLYVQDQIRFGDGWILTGNIRHDLVETHQDGAAGFHRDDSETSYRAAVAYEFSGGVTPYFSYSTSFNPLIVSSVNGVTEPEFGEQFELGMKMAPDHGRYYFNAAVFHIERQNVVVGIFPNQEQLGEVRSRGAELEGGYDFSGGLSLAVAATLLDVEVTKDSNAARIGNSPTLTPEYEITARADYAFQGFLDGLSLGAAVRHRGESFANDTNSLAVPTSTIFDVYGSYRLLEDTSVNLTAINIADRRYVTGCQTEFVCSYGSGREVSLALTHRW